MLFFDPDVINCWSQAWTAWFLVFLSTYRATS